MTIGRCRGAEKAVRSAGLAAPPLSTTAARAKTDPKNPLRRHRLPIMRDLLADSDPAPAPPPLKAIGRPPAMAPYRNPGSGRAPIAVRLSPYAQLVPSHGDHPHAGFGTPTDPGEAEILLP